MVSSLYFLLCLINPKLGAKETVNLETQMGVEPKSPNKNLLFLAKGPRMGQSSKAEHFETITAQFQLNTTGKLWPPRPPMREKADRVVWTCTLTRL